MKKLIIGFFLFSSCNSYQTAEERVNIFIKTSKRPILVKETSIGSETGKKDMTLISDDGKVLYIEYTSICLPDTIK